MGTHIKAASMDDMRSTPDTKKMEQAFERFGRRAPRIVVPSRMHLGGVHRPGVSCDHRWTEVTDPTQRAFVLKKHEEESADVVAYCPDCGATCLRDAGKDDAFAPIFSYDATFRFTDRSRKEKR